jgi:hypothetical protein
MFPLRKIQTVLTIYANSQVLAVNDEKNRLTRATRLVVGSSSALIEETCDV